MSAAKLYTPEVLRAAVALARYPLLPDFPLTSEARSPSCGSTLRIGLSVDDGGAIDRLGLSLSACAIGQASAAIFAGNAVGSSAQRIGASRNEIEAWLGGERAMPDWPGLELIAAARDYPARHGAILLAWNAAIRALDNQPRG
ncbi:iron-sulfur cluster assembly scaffold protein [Croceicoccus mobilis]|uniref:Iron-sulfur cluster scaffold-like protein n=1 Tax=Croceicoccus mobilis TaxID=1703339 RepID=A0A916YX06_9SPHN|nr:iron-sulfur cluster assembly scaffold protein [Croceicoccus mobilis]GGD64978.1 iron-sulfur cluster scaffold-like protein [Croceicoccus mobilis]